MVATHTPLHAICDADACQRAGWGLVDFADACLLGGARLLQVRAKSAPAGLVLELTQLIVERARQAGSVVIVNDRADIALLASAGGVHVGQDDLAPADARKVVGEERIVGLSTHTLDQIDEALTESIDYLAVGPVFATSTKDTGYDAVGLDRVRAAAERAARRLPVVAIGGITLDRAPAVLAAGATSVAVIGDLLSTGDPAARVREYLQQLGTR